MGRIVFVPSLLSIRIPHFVLEWHFLLLGPLNGVPSDLGCPEAGFRFP